MAAINFNFVSHPPCSNAKRVVRDAAAMLLGVALCGTTSAQTTQLYWGDMHLHTSNSTDAYEDGKAAADIETAYRFARGLPVVHPATGVRIRLDRPLDFLLVSDHSEMLSVVNRLAQRDPVVIDTDAGKRLRALFDQDPRKIMEAQIAISLEHTNQDFLEQMTTAAVRSEAWFEQVDAAERHNKPHEFTALIGWEWSSTPNGINFHRNVFTAAGGDKAKHLLPFSSYDSERPEELWRWLEQTEQRVGIEFLAIPHNSNLSAGKMFALADSDGRPLTAAYARTRARFETVAEVTQYKGTSEIHPALSPDDAFADFEIQNNLFNNTPAAPDRGSYLRTALLDGIAAEARVGTNPFKLGLIGSTDSHTGLSSVDEEHFYGKTGLDSLPEQRRDKVVTRYAAWDVSAGGLAAAWATENTREGIFNAFRRREVYGTSGPRIVLRVFGGFDFITADATAADLASVGYRKGVPMGADLASAPAGKTPALLIHAARDPLGANLDRIQVIKGWLSASGEVEEHVYDVAWSGERQRAADGSLPPVGNTVDLATAGYSNSIGAAQLATVWQDPDFDPTQRAFYYVRVLEIPTPRQQVFDAVALGIDPTSINRPTTLQERAYSSPIWYTP